jgi:IPT/TIG domain
MVTIIIKSISAVFILSILIASNSFAAQPQVTINEVMVDFNSQSISIMGENFDIGPNSTTVSLGGFGNLNITINSSNLLVADLPNGISPGDYLLSVSSGPGPRKNAEESITIGAQGPQGDVGD